MRNAVTLCATLVAGLVIAGCACPHAKDAASAESAHAAKCEACGRGKQGEAVWCDACGHGFVGGEVVKCRGCYDAKTGGAPCATCAAKKS